MATSAHVDTFARDHLPPPSALPEFRFDRPELQLPERLNVAAELLDRWVAQGQGGRIAVIGERDGQPFAWTYAELQQRANRIAQVLVKRMGLVPGQRVLLRGANTPMMAACWFGVIKAGGIAVGTMPLLRERELQPIIDKARITYALCDARLADALQGVRAACPQLAQVRLFNGDAGAGSLEAEMAAQPADFATVDTAADDPAIIIYTSGTTGNPKGALHAHRVLLGHLPNVEMAHDFFPKPGDLMWTPADWAWIGGLFDALFPAWYHGVPVLGHRARKFEPQAAMQLMADHKVRNVFLPPTALKLMRQANVRHEDVKLRSIFSGGESLGAELLSWVRATFGIEAHEIYGQTECNLVVGNNTNLFPLRPGSMGKATPGFEVRIVDERGEELPRGTQGIIGVRAPNPCMMLEYWKNPEATAKKYAGGFLLTGDLGMQDDDGYFWYVSREDDVITSAGYRIGPAEIEHTLMKHPAVAMSAVVGIPDPIRTEAIKAWIVLRPGFTAGDALARDIQDFVKVQLAAHEYPRHIQFTDTLPMTATGKVLRRELRTLG